MATIRIGSGGCRVRIKVGAGARVTITSSADGVSVRIAEDLDATDVLARYYGGRTMAKRDRLPRGRSGVSREMEAAAVRSFLAGADVARLGRSLIAVYEAMEAARLRGEGDDG